MKISYIYNNNKQKAADYSENIESGKSCDKVFLEFFERKYAD